MKLSKSVNDFKIFLEVVDKNKSPNTCQSYVSALQVFITTIGDKNAENLNVDDFIKFKKSLLDKAVSTSTIATYFSGLLKYLKFLSMQYRLRPVHSDDIRILRPTVKQRIPDALERFEISALLEAAETIEERFAIELMYATGLRVTEVLKIKKTDITEKEFIAETGNVSRIKWLKILGKGNKERMVPLNRGDIAEKLEGYLKHREERYNGKREYLFDFSYKTLWRRVKEIGRKAQIKVRPHQLRHSFATDMLDCGNNIEDIQKIMGHESISTTVRYAKVKDKNLIKAMGKSASLREFEER